MYKSVYLSIEKVSSYHKKKRKKEKKKIVSSLWITFNFPVILQIDTQLDILSTKDQQKIDDNNWILRL